MALLSSQPSITICSWLLSKHPMFVRTTHDVYLKKASTFIEKVVEQVKDLQFFTANGPKGGPIIMTQVQLQNKYCSNTDTIFRLRMNTELLGTTISLETLLTCTV